jgi:hypothetical protein
MKPKKQFYSATNSSESWHWAGQDWPCSNDRMSKQVLQEKRHSIFHKSQKRESNKAKKFVIPSCCTHVERQEWITTRKWHRVLYCIVLARCVLQNVLFYSNLLILNHYSDSDTDSDATLCIGEIRGTVSPKYKNTTSLSLMHKRMREMEYRLYARTGRAPGNWHGENDSHLAVIPKYGNDTLYHNLAALGWNSKDENVELITISTLEEWREQVVKGKSKEAAKVVDKLKAIFAFTVEMASSPDELEGFIRDMEDSMDGAFAELTAAAIEKMKRRDPAGPTMRRIGKRYMGLKLHLNKVLTHWKSSIANRDFMGSGTYHHRGQSWYAF